MQFSNFLLIGFAYNNIIENVNNITLPNGWYQYLDTEVLIFFYTKLDTMSNFVKVFVRKQIVIIKDHIVRCYILDYVFSEEDLLLPKILTFSNQEIKNVILLLDKKSVCTGGPNALNYAGLKFMIEKKPA